MGSASSRNFEIDAVLLDAMARWSLGETDAAEASVERALALAEPTGRVFMFLTVPGTRKALERHPVHRTAHPGICGSCSRPRSGRRGAGRRARGLCEALSERELAVLRLLSTNLSAGEIGGELFLAVHTVKTHMRKLYAKLDVHRWAEAVQRARALGLLGPDAGGLTVRRPPSARPADASHVHTHRVMTAHTGEGQPAVP